MSDETWDAWSRGCREGQTCVCRQVADEIRADERRRVLDELHKTILSVYHSGGDAHDGMVAVKGYIKVMREEVSDDPS